MVRVFDRTRSSSFKLKKKIFGHSHSFEGNKESNNTCTGSMEPQELVLSPRKNLACTSAKHLSDIDLMKERFAKLLLGEDMSGGGKGVSSALALSNAITNLSASVYGEQKRLEPMAPDRKARWRKEMDWLLSVTDHIVELVPSKQQAPDGSAMEIMVSKQRSDLLLNIPALRKLDAMLLDCLDDFEGQTEFTYVDSKDANEAEKATGQRNNDKWWIPTVKIPPGGLSDATRKWLQHQKDAVNQVQKAAMAINAQVLLEMSVPDNYTDSLPKNGRASLGDTIYKSITDETFDPDGILSSIDLTSELQVLDLKNRIEASIVIWKRKMSQKDGKSSWSSSVSIGKRELFEERAETLLLILKRNFPGLPQSSLDISKIQYNKDVGHAVLESYSRVLESVAAAIMNRVDDVTYADNKASKLQPQESNVRLSSVNSYTEKPETPTLSDYMGWEVGKEERKKKGSNKFNEMFLYHENEKQTNKSPPDSNKVSYLEKLEHLGGLRSPTSRH